MTEVVGLLNKYGKNLDEKPEDSIEKMEIQQASELLTNENINENN